MLVTTGFFQGPLILFSGLGDTENFVMDFFSLLVGKSTTNLTQKIPNSCQRVKHKHAPYK